MQRVLLCSHDDLRAELATTPIGRQGIDLYRAPKFDDARLLAKTLGVQLVLIDRDMPHALTLIERMRQDDTLRSRSIAVVARGDFRPEELDLLEAGANAILRLPPDGSWAERLPKLLAVPVRQEARLPVQIAVDMEPEIHGEIVNLSSGGMLVATPRPLPLLAELGFRFAVPTGGAVQGRARVTREAAGVGWGLEFVHVGDHSRTALGQYLRSARLA